MLAEQLIKIYSDPYGEIQIGMHRANRETASRGQRFEEPELD